MIKALAYKAGAFSNKSVLVHENFLKYFLFLKKLPLCLLIPINSIGLIYYLFKTIPIEDYRFILPLLLPVLFFVQ